MVRVSIEWERLPRELVVKPQDIERGYVEVDAVGIGVRSNNPAGVRIRFVARSAHLSDVDVEGRGPAIFVPQVGRGLQRQSIGVRLKLKLAPGAVPGTIAYPVSVSVTPA